MINILYSLNSEMNDVVFVFQSAAGSLWTTVFQTQHTAWEGPFPSSLKHLPICSGYCDEWYQACAEDLACAANWITDWNYTDNGNNHCRAEAKCSGFDQVHRLHLTVHFPL